MTNIHVYEVYATQDGALYFRMHGEWKPVSGTVAVCAGPAANGDETKQLRRAFIDEDGRLTYSDGGYYCHTDISEASKASIPRLLSADANGALYAYRGGVLSQVSVS